MQFISKKNIIFIVSGLLMIGAAIYAAQWKWHFWQPAMIQSSQPFAASPVEDNPVEDENEVPGNSVGIREVLSAHLFGQEGVTKKVLNSSGSIPKTQQPLELHGIVFIPHHPERAVALIAQAGGIAKDYKTGDEILPFLPGWKVFLISPDSVQIEHEGTVELLELPRSPTQLDSTVPIIHPDSPVNNAPPQNNLPMPQENLPPQDDSAPPVELPPPEGAPEGAQELGLKKTTDGFILDSAKSAQALGLKRSDKIIAISGYDFSDLENDPAVLEQLLAQSAIEAVIDRKGQVINFSVPKNLVKSWRTTIKS